jgi:hypothetical protein
MRYLDRMIFLPHTPWCAKRRYSLSFEVDPRSEILTLIACSRAGNSGLADHLKDHTDGN